MKAITKGAAALVMAVAIAAATPHFGLSKSMPAAGTSVSSPELLQLWFTQAPQEGSVTIRLLDAGGDMVETGEVERDGEDRKLMSVAVDGTLSGGTYTVSWRGIGDDGHVVRDDFEFSVADQR